MEQTYSSWLTRRLPRPLAALALLLATAGAAQAQTPAATFAAAATYGTGGSFPYSIAVADVNGDGKPDLLTANYYGNSAGVLLGTGTGTFGAATTYSTGGSFPYSIAVADVNGDGKPDLLTANQGSNTAGVLLGTGTGTFGTATTFSTGANSSPTSIAVADVNGDGKPDLLTANQGNTAGVLLNTTVYPPTAIGTATTYDTGGSRPYSIAVADVNGDGKPDLLTANYGTSTAGVLLGTGTGAFGAAATFSTGSGSQPQSIAVADVNGDGKLDLLTANYGTSTAGVLLGTGSGAFGTVTTFSTGSGSQPRSIAVADVNGDGKLDLLTANYNSNTAGVLLGTGSGTFGAATTFGTGSGSQPRSIAVADVNGDGKPDLLTGNASSSTAGVLLGTGTGAFGTVATYSTGPTSFPISIAVADVNGDGKPDLLTANASVGTASVLLGTGTGAFGTAATFDTGPGSNPYSIAVADVNGDGKPDLLTANLGSNTAGVLPGTGTGTFGTATTSSTGANSQPVSLAVADVNGDGKLDVLTANYNSNTAGVLLNATVSAPTLTTISPNPAAVGAQVTLTGTDLTGATGVSFNGTAATVFSVVNATTLTATVPTGATTGPVTVATPGGTSNGVTFTVITATTWTGAVNTDWYTAGNWTQGVPDATIDATIPTAPSGGRFPAVAAGTAIARNLTLSSGATLNQSGGTLALAGNLTNNGTFLPTGGTVSLGSTTLGSTTLSSVLGSGNIRFWNLTVGANGAQLSTSAGASMQRLLTLNGNFATNANSFVLESNNTLAALVVNNGSNVVTGTVTVQRAIDPSVNPGLGYRHYAAPVSNSTVTDLATSGFAPVVNPAYNTSAAPYAVTPFPTVFGYDDSRLATTTSNNLTSFDKGYYSPATASDPLAVGKGYTVNIAASELVDFQGQLNNGDQSLNLTSTRNTYPDGGWQLLGNPYPAPLDYSRVAAADRAGLESAIYVYSSTSQYQGRYRVYINGIGNPVVPLGQGFFARVAAGQATATMTFRNAHRLTAPNATTLQRTTADPRPLVQLTLQGQGAAPADEAYVYFENGATSGFDAAFDAEKLPNPTGLNLSTTQASQQLSIDGQPELGTAQRIVPLAVGVPAGGVYTFTASQLLNLSTVPVYLRDRQLGTLTDLRQRPTYQFVVSSAAALNTSRFELVFSPQQPLATVPTALAQQVAVYPNPARTQVAIELPSALSRQPVTASLVDALGRTVRTQVLPANLAVHALSLSGVATGVYALRLSTEAGLVVKKLVID